MFILLQPLTHSVLATVQVEWQDGMILKKINKKAFQLPKNLVKLDKLGKIIQIFIIVHNLKNNNYCLEVGWIFWFFFFSLLGMIIMLFSTKYLKSCSLNENASQRVCFTGRLLMY